MKYLVCVLLMVVSGALAQPTDTIYRSTDVDIKPNLKDGMYKLTEFVSNNFKFPPSVKNKKVRIFTSFVVEPDGRMTDVKSFYISVKEYLPVEVVSIQTEEEKAAEQKVFDSMRDEAARVLKLFTDTWTPAMVSGKPVRCLYNYPISFNIE